MIELRELQFQYSPEGFALRIEDLQVARGERLAVVGASGSGKTTLLDLIAGIRVPSRGEVLVAGEHVSTMTPRAARQYRLEHIGLIFQAFELLEYLSVGDNITLPYRIGSNRVLTGEVRARAQMLAARCGLGDRLQRYPHQLSQGERQRVAICRALVTNPAIVLADEPTGNLDPQTKHKVLDLLLAEVEQRAATLVMVTHDHDLLARFDRVLDMQELL